MSEQEIAARYEAEPRPACPQCGSNDKVAFIVRGKPSAELLAYSQRPNSRVHLGGCMVSPSDPAYYCNACSLGFGARG